MLRLLPAEGRRLEPLRAICVFFRMSCAEPGLSGRVDRLFAVDAALLDVSLDFDTQAVGFCQPIVRSRGD